MMAGNANSISGEFGRILVKKVVVGANTVANTTDAIRYLRSLRTDQSSYLLAAYRSPTSPAPVTNEFGNMVCYANYNGYASFRFWKWDGSRWEQRELNSAPTQSIPAKLTNGSVYYLVEYFMQA